MNKCCVEIRALNKETINYNNAYIERTDGSISNISELYVLSYIAEGWDLIDKLPEKNLDYGENIFFEDFTRLYNFTGEIVVSTETVETYVNLGWSVDSEVSMYKDGKTQKVPLAMVYALQNDGWHTGQNCPAADAS